MAQPRPFPISLLFAAFLSLIGCRTAPSTVPSVDLERYTGLWYQVAGYPFKPTRGLVGITAVYTLNDDGTVQVINRGYEGDFDGSVNEIEGVARVVDEETNAKLKVKFPSVFFGLFEGQYWIVDLDDENYSYAAVSDSFRATLFILSRTPQMNAKDYEALIERLVADGFDRDRIVQIPQRTEGPEALLGGAPAFE